MKPHPDAAPLTPRKPRFALAVATCFGLGYVRKSPGTAGSLLGICLAIAFPWSVLVFGTGRWSPGNHLPSLGQFIDSPALHLMFLTALTSAVGVWAAAKASRYLKVGDPQVVVIDEVSGQLATFLFGGSGPLVILDRSTVWNPRTLGIFHFFVLNWKYLLLGFILFRVFDIWKPFPVRQAEKLPGGWGIMADDWVAAIYAALGLWVARYLGL